MTELGGGGPVGGASFEIISTFDPAGLRTAEKEIDRTAGVFAAAAARIGRSMEKTSSGIFIPPGAAKRAAEEVKEATEAVTDFQRAINSLTRNPDELIDPGSVERANELLRQIETRLTRLQQTAQRVDLTPAGQRTIEDLKEQQRFLQVYLGTVRSDTAGLTKFEQTQLQQRARAHQQFVQTITRMSRQVTQTEQKRVADQTRAEEQLVQNLTRMSRQVTQTELKRINDLKKAEERAAAEQAAFINRAAPELFKERTRQQLEAQRAQMGLIASSGKLSRAFEELEAKGGRFGGVFGRVGRVLGAAEQQLDNFGLSVSDVSILLGAGFAGGVAGLVQVGLKLVDVLRRMAVETAKFLFEAAVAADELNRFRDRAVTAFGDAGNALVTYSQNVAAGFGLTERAALEHTGTIANMFKSFDVGSESAVRFSLAMANAATVIRQTSFTSDSLEEVLGKLRGSLTGNVEALREYGIAVNEQTLKQTAAAHGIELVTGELDAETKALLAFLFVQDEARKRQDDFSTSQESLLTTQQKLSVAWEEFQTTIGDRVLPAVTALVDLGSDAINFVSDFTEAVLDSIDPLVRFASATSDLLNLPEIGAILFGTDSEKAFDKFAAAVEAFDPESMFPEVEIADFRKETNKLFADFEKGKISADEFFVALTKQSGIVDPYELQVAYEAFFNTLVQERPELEKYRDELFNTRAAQSAAERAARDHQAELRETPEHIQKVVDAYKGLQEALEDAAEAESDAREALAEARKDAAKQITDAEESLAEAREDSAERIADAQEALADAEVDAAERVRDAEEALEEAREDARERILDAEEKLRETREDAAEKVSDAEEKLAETREDNTRRIQDAEQRLHDARIQQAQQIGDAQRSLEEARRSGDLLAQNRAAIELDRAKKSNTVRDAERGLVDARREAIEKLKDAEEALNDARIEAAEAVSDAEEALADTIEEAHERIRDSEEALADAREEAIERVQEAHERLIEAQEEGLERVTDAEERLRDVRVEAAERIRDAEEKLAEVLESNTERIEEARDKVAELEGEFKDNTERVRELNSELEKTKRIIAEIQGQMTTSSFTGLPTAPFFPPGLHEGGFAAAHRSYWVGEKGPELWVGSTSGTVISNEVLRIFEQMFRRGFPIGTPGGGITNNIFESVDPRTTAFEISRMMAQQVNN